MKRSLRCPKCDGSMTEGFVIDEGHGYKHVSRWQAGKPKKSFWTGIKLNRAEQRKIASFRCDRCGYLESYALSE